MTVEYENGKPVRLDSVVVSCQHTEEKDLKKLEAEIRKKVLLPVLRPLPPDEETKTKTVFRFLSAGLFDNAQKVVEEILEKNHYNSRALFAKLLIHYEAK